MRTFTLIDSRTGEVSFDGRPVSRSHRCPVCDRDSWCLLDADRGLVICPRTEGVRKIGDAGWLHTIRAGVSAPDLRSCTRPPEEIQPLPDAGNMQAKFLRQGGPRIGLLALALGVSRESLVRLGTGWNGSAWTFPMRNHRDEIVGFRTRLENGQKLAIRGSRSGLFIPRGAIRGEIIWIVEGPSDVAAMLDMGLNAIGRPSCRGSEKEIQRWVRGHRVVIVSDNDGAGIGGAESLERTLRGSVSSVETILPPWGMKDAREVANHGGKSDDWLILIGGSNDRRNFNGRQA
jgi:hypothetical protein